MDENPYRAPDATGDRLPRKLKPGLLRRIASASFLGVGLCIAFLVIFALMSIATGEPPVEGEWNGLLTLGLVATGCFSAAYVLQR